ncbi:hypothetical protein NPIL_117131 [Nephila pilipes]|uniref:Uncharacterized protein n=1 Tax=Nephila pilipes TaxID=299642 RepID=A0A8X6TXT9_NEPPI|nr:hypothetical protein NPIL_117131 [Nephila pilipes]
MQVVSDYFLHFYHLIYSWIRQIVCFVSLDKSLFHSPESAHQKRFISLKVRDDFLQNCMSQTSLLFHRGFTAAFEGNGYNLRLVSVRLFDVAKEGETLPHSIEICSNSNS